MMGKNVLIVGAGLAGLATALRLSKSGYKVKIIEKNEKAGGRLNQISFDGFKFDIGPSFFSMSYEFENFANECGIALPFKYYPLDPLYVVNFNNSKDSFYLYKNIDKLAEQFKNIEPDFADKFRKYLGKSKEMFDDTVDVVIKSNFDSLMDYFTKLMTVNPKHLPNLFNNFYKHVSNYFDSETTRQIISLVAFFLGRTPFDTSAIYSLLSYTEFVHDGYYNVEGGMYAIVEGIVKELEKEKVEFVFNSEIIDFNYKDDKLEYLKDNKGINHTADIFLVNSDAAFFRGKVFKREKYSTEKLNKMDWTMGYLTMYVGLDTKLPQVHHHNYFLGNNFDIYAKNVHKNLGTFEKPYYYVNVLSRNNQDVAPEGCEGLFFVCPVPDLKYKPNWDDAGAIVDSILTDFSKRIGLDISKHIIAKKYYTPLDWQNKFNLFRGSGLGLSHKMLQIGAFRPSNFDEYFSNVFYAGASTVPGAGLPMAIISSKLAHQRIEQYANNIK